MSVSLKVEVRRGDLHLQVDTVLPSGTTGVFGPNGCGKSTLLHAVAGLLPGASQVVVDGEPLHDLPPHKRRIGVVFQDLRLFPHLTVRQNLAYGATGPLDEAIALLALAPFLDRRPGGLSGGERQRVAIARALVTRPRLLLMDEPLSALDARRRAEVLPYLRRVAEGAGVPVLYVSHRLSEILQLTSHLLVLADGKLIGNGPVQALLGEERVLALAHRLGLENVLAVEEASVSGGLVRARVGTRWLILPPEPPEGVLQTGRGQLRLRPEDVLLATGDPGPTSARNVVPGEIRRLTPVAGRWMAQIDIGVPLAVELTRSAVDELELAPGVAVLCLIKTTAFRWV